MSKAQAKVQTKAQQKYELQSNNTTVVMTQSMREIDEAWQKSNNCTLYQFNSDGSKFKVNSKRTKPKVMLKKNDFVSGKTLKTLKKSIRTQTTKTGERLLNINEEVKHDEQE